ncbi:MAG TPA: FAD-dependent monooxygenase [Puia sp.]|nr:FAD-dependent monooxygenase [Puia sp.]
MPPKVLISGASIAGPALAFWLQRYGFDVTIVEKAPSIRKGGYRIDLRGKAIDVAARMGLLDDIRRHHTTLKGSSLVNGKGRRYVDLNDPNLFGMRRPEDVEIMRGHLTEILYAATKDKVTYLFNNSVTSVEDAGDHVDVAFRNGAWDSYDYVIGADGLHSAVRRLAFGPDSDFIHHLGFNLCIFSVPNDQRLDRWELLYPLVQKGINVFSTHGAADAMAFFLFRAPASPLLHRDAEAQKQTLLDNFFDEGPAVRQLLSHMDSASDLYFDNVSQVRMPMLYNGRIALLGDAGYCPSPASGQGTSLALVGAYILAGEMAKKAGDHPGAFAAYQRIMEPFIYQNQQLAETALKGMIPSSKLQLQFQNFMLRLLLQLPGKERVFRGFFSKMQEAVSRAAQGIDLPDYASLVKNVRKTDLRPFLN